MDMWGIPSSPIDVAEMVSPYKCARCDNVHDAGAVEVVGRYSDCSLWKCPGCGATIDDRPIGWGGSAIPLGLDGLPKR